MFSAVNIGPALCICVEVHEGCCCDRRRARSKETTPVYFGAVDLWSLRFALITHVYSLSFRAASCLLCPPAYLRVSGHKRRVGGKGSPIVCLEHTDLCVELPRNY